MSDEAGYPRELRVRAADREIVMLRRDGEVAVGVSPASAADVVPRILADPGLTQVEAALGRAPSVLWLEVTDGRDPAEVAADLAAQEGVWLAAPVYAPEGAGSSVDAAAPLTDVLVLTPEPESREDLVGLLAERGFVLDAEWSRAMTPLLRLVAGPGEPRDLAVRVLDELREHPAVAAAGLDWAAMSPLQLELPATVSGFARQWNLSAMRMSQAWDDTTGSPRVVVAVVDGGVDTAHPAIAGALAQAHTHVGIEIVNGMMRIDADGRFPPYPPPPELLDARPHGTAVAGIIAASIGGSSKIAGIAPGCRLLPVRLTPMTDSTVALGVTLAVARGARIVNLSITAVSGDAGVDHAIGVARLSGTVVCAAAGNDYVPRTDTAYPARRPDVMGVGAFVQDGTPKAGPPGEAWHSRTGPGLDVLAPGLAIPSIDALGKEGYNAGGPGRRVEWYGRQYTATETGDAKGDYLWVFTGTSAAAGHASGLAALVMSLCPGLTADEVTDLVRRTCDDMAGPPGSAGQSTGRTDAVGWGRVNAARALSAAASMGRCRDMPGDDKKGGKGKKGDPVPVSPLIAAILAKSGRPPDATDLPDVVVLVGWPGLSAREGWLRLYLTLSFDDWAEFPANAVVYSQALPDPQGGPDNRVRLWIERGADIKRVRSRWSTVGGDYLGGPITSEAGWDGIRPGADDPWDPQPTSPCPCGNKTR